MKKFYYVHLYLFVLFFLYLSCDEDSKGQSHQVPIVAGDSLENASIDSLKKDSINNSIKKTGELLSYEVDCTCGKGTLTANTQYINLEDTDTLSRYKYIIISQSLIFQQHGKRVKKLIPPFRKMNRMILNKKTDVPITLIAQVKCIQNKENYIYSIYGANIYDPPHEFFALCSLDGKWLWFFYGDRYDAYDSWGKHDKYVEIFGEEVNNSINMIEVTPDRR
jgi:hypothetical protein